MLDSNKRKQPNTQMKEKIKLIGAKKTFFSIFQNSRSSFSIVISESFQLFHLLRSSACHYYYLWWEFNVKIVFVINTAQHKRWKGIKKKGMTHTFLFFVSISADGWKQIVKNETQVFNFEWISRWHPNR